MSRFIVNIPKFVVAFLLVAAIVNLLVGVEAQTRIVGTETKPVCPFPNAIEIVPQLSTGKVSIGVPIDSAWPRGPALARQSSQKVSLSRRACSSRRC